MIAVDTNLLVYAHRGDSEWHAAAKACLVELADSGAPSAIAWSSLHEFVAVVTHPRIYTPPTPQATAFAAIKAWLASPGLQLLHEGPRISRQVRTPLRKSLNRRRGAVRARLRDWLRAWGPGGWAAGSRRI